VLISADELVFLAASRAPRCAQRLDKYVVG